RGKARSPSWYVPGIAMERDQASTTTALMRPPAAAVLNHERTHHRFPATLRLAGITSVMDSVVTQSQLGRGWSGRVKTALREGTPSSFLILTSWRRPHLTPLTPELPHALEHGDPKDQVHKSSQLFGTGLTEAQLDNWA